MFAVTNEERIAVNIDNAEKIQAGYDPVFRTYCVELCAFDGSFPGCKLGKYDTIEDAEKALGSLLIAAAENKKVFFMPPREVAENV